MRKNLPVLRHKKQASGLPLSPRLTSPFPSRFHLPFPAPQNIFQKELKGNCIIDNYGNLIVKIPAKNTNCKEPVLFSVHADTVKPGKNIEPVLKDGIICSKGDTILGVDDKAGIAVLFEAIRKAGQYSPLEIIFSKEEEIGLLGSKNIDRSLLESKIGFVIDTRN